MRSAVVVAALAAVTVACGAGTRAPLSVAIASPRDAVERSLRDNGYCRDRGPVRAIETYRDCGQPGLELGDSWVVVYFDRADLLIKVERFERFPSHDDARNRWNELVQARRKRDGRESEAARDALQRDAELPAGTVSWLSWFDGKGGIASVFLLRARTASDPNVLELLIPGSER